jgi:DNA-binding MarR family transcriptional regulator
MSELQRELKQERPFRPAQEALLAILRTADVLRRRLAEVTGRADLTLQQYNVLRILRGSRGQPLATLEIGERLIEQTPGITRLLDRLEAKGLVRRERCREDRRQVHCHITDRGLALLAELDGPIDAADEAAMRALGPAEIGELVALLERVRCDLVQHSLAAEAKDHAGIAG